AMFAYDGTVTWDNTTYNYPPIQVNPTKQSPAYYKLMGFAKFQIQPTQKQCNLYLPNSGHASNIMVSLGDGSARPVSQSVSSDTWWAAVTPNGGDTLGSDWVL